MTALPSFIFNIFPKRLGVPTISLSLGYRQKNTIQTAFFLHVEPSRSARTLQSLHPPSRPPPLPFLWLSQGTEKTVGRDADQLTFPLYRFVRPIYAIPKFPR